MRTQILRRLITVAVVGSVISLFITQTMVGKTLPIPVPNGVYKISRLYDLIRSNEKQAEFFILTSQGADSAKKNSNRPSEGDNSKVTLLFDSGLHGMLINKHHLDSETDHKYVKLLLYFMHGGQKFYLVNPWPGQIKRMGRRVERPVDRYINKWDFTATFPPG